MKFFQQTADDIHGDPINLLPNSILVSTDCVGELKNGIIVALRLNKQVANRIVMNNVTLIILFWYEYEKSCGDEEKGLVLSSRIDFLNYLFQQQSIYVEIMCAEQLTSR